MIDALIVIVVFAVLAELFVRLFFGGTNLAGAMGGLFTGLRAHGWPQGVQEEDRDRAWGRLRPGTPKPAAVERELRPALAKVKPVIRPR